MSNSILIGGCGSSGTTLLRELINIHPAIYCGPELSVFNKRLLFHQQYQLTRQNFGYYLQNGMPTQGCLDVEWLPWSTSGYLRRELRFFEAHERYGFSQNQLEQLARESQSWKELCDNFFEAVLQQAGKDRWAEKTPSNCYCIAEFLSMYPQGQYVHVMRDGRDVVVSLMKRGLPAPAAVRRWMYDSATYLPHRNDPRVHCIRYEDLVQDAGITLQRLYHFLGEDAEKIPVQKQVLDDAPEGHASWTLQPEQEISTAAMQKWKKRDYPDKVLLEQLFHRTRFSSPVAQFLELNASTSALDLLAQFGYDPGDGWQKPAMPDLRWLRFYLREARGKDKPVGLNYFLAGAW